MIVKIGIVGSRAYTDKKKIAEVISQLHLKYGPGLTIVSGGQKEGVDGFAKEIALAKKLYYHEFPPAHYAHNEYCVLGPEHYGKPYHVSHYHIRNEEIAKYSDYMFVFTLRDVISNGSTSVMRYAKQHSTPFVELH